MNARQQFGFTRTLIYLPVFAACSAAQADEISDVELLTKPESSVSLGAGITNGNSDEKSLSGAYNGLRDHTGAVLLDADIVKRDDATGTWTTLEGRNLGLDNREFGFSQQRQGQWKYFVDYSELVRHDPRTINTALRGAGTTTPTVVLLGTPGAGSDLDLELKRKSLGIGGNLWISSSLQLDVSFKQEDKNGARLFGIGNACSATWQAAGACTSSSGNVWAELMLPEPIKSTTRQIEAKLSYSGDKLALSGGYYGSFFTNSYGSLTPGIPATLSNYLGAPIAVDAGLRTTLGLPIALPPDNQAHQLYLSGNYAFTPTTHASFKYAYSHATQDDSFLGSGLTGAPNGRSDLGGVVDTTLLQLGLTARPLSKLSLLANLRYEDKKDKTPIDMYNVEGVNTFSNGHVSSRKLGGKLEATYRVFSTTRATLGVDYQQVKRELPPSTDTVAGLQGLRGETEEMGYRAEVHQTITEGLSGTLGYGSSRRTGSDWYNVATKVVDPALGDSLTAVFPATLTDRTRNKWRAALDWSPSDSLSIQVNAEDGTDHYTMDTVRGLQESGMSLFGLDATWSVNDKWKLTGYASHGEQTLRVRHNTDTGSLKNTSDTFGMGLTGNPSARLQVGADLSYTSETDRYDQWSTSNATNTFLATSGGLPDVQYRLTTLKLFAKYALEKNSDLTFSLIHQRTRLKEWTWNNRDIPFTYSDNTTVSTDQNQNFTFFGVVYVYKFR